MKFSSLSRWFGKQRSARARRPADRERYRSRLHLEHLESRELLSNDTPFLVASGIQPANGSTITNTTVPIVVSFSEDMVRAEAQNVNNYLLLNSSNQAIPINGASYIADPAQQKFQVVLGYNNGAPLPADRYSLYVRGDRIHDVDDGRPLAQPGQLVVANSTQPFTVFASQAQTVGLLSQVDMPGDGSLNAVTNYAPNPAQSTTTTQSPVPSIPASPAAVSLTDMNGDGIADLVVATSFPPSTGSAFLAGVSQVNIFRGLPGPNGGFENSPSRSLQLPPFGFAGVIPVPTAMAVGDFNGDAIPDVAVTVSGTDELLVMLQDKTGNFGNPARFSVTPTFATADPVGVVAADFNGDGRIDFAVADQATNDVVILLGQPGGAFSNARSIINPNTTTLQAPTGIAFGDLNGDGRPDLAVSNAGGVNYYLNTTPNGSPNPSFGERTLTFTPPGSTTPLGTTAVAIGNIDNSAGPDIVATANVPGPFGSSTQSGDVLVWQSGGNGNFGLASAFPVGPDQSSFFNPSKGLDKVKLADVNGDGLDDVLATQDNGQNFAGNLIVLTNQTAATGVARLSAPAKYAVDSGPLDLATHSTAGKVDEVATANAFSNQFFFSNSGDVTVLRARGDGTFLVSRDLNLPSPTANQPGYSALTTADLNGDGRPDAILADAINNTVTVALSTPAGTYSTTSYTVGQNPSALAVADLTGTGRLDILVVNSGSDSVSILQNNGNGIFNPLPEMPVGTAPTAIAVADFNGDGKLDLAVTHQGATIPGFFAAQVKEVVTVFSGNGDRTFRNPTDFTLNQPTAVAIAAADFNGDGNVDLAVVDGQVAGNIELLVGDGTGIFSLSNIFPAGESPRGIAVGDLNGDGLPDIVVTNQSAPPFFFSLNSTNVSTDYVSVLLNTPGIQFGKPIRTNVLANTDVQLQNVVITDVNQDNNPDIVVSFGQSFNAFFSIFAPSSVGSFNSVAALTGFGDGTFDTPRFYAVDGGTGTSVNNLVAVASDPFLKATQFVVHAPNVSTNLIENGSFDAVTLQAEKGNLSGWESFNERDSRGYFATQTGQLSPLSGVTVQNPTRRYAAMLDQADLVPFTAVNAQGIGADPASGGLFGVNIAYPDGPFRQPSDYNGAHALFQDILVPDSATSVTLSLDLYINNNDPTNTFGYSDPNVTSSLDYFPGMPNAPANQQVRVDIVDPTAPRAADPLDTTRQTSLDHSGSVLLNVFQTRQTTPRVFGYQTITADLTQFRGRLIRLRVGEVNNKGKLIVGVDNVSVRASYVDSHAPAINGLHLRNPGFGATSTFGGNTTDPTLVGQVSEDGSPSNIEFLAFDTNNDGDFSGPDDFRITPLVPTALDALGNFQFTVPVNLPGPYTIGVEAVDRAGNVTTTSFTFNFQGPSLTSFQAMGPGPIRYVAQGADYSTVSGRITSVAVDPRDPSGNTFYVGSVNGGVWRTLDGGNNWTPLTNFQQSLVNIPTAIASVAVDPNDPNTVYAATGIADNALDSHPGVGILKSTNNGQNWSLVGSSVFNGARFTKIVVVRKNNPTDPNEPTRIYAAVASGGAGPGIYESTDGGNSWTNVLNPALMNLDAGGTLGAGHALASVTDLQVDQFNNEVLWAGLGNIGLVPSSDSGGVWRSNNGGASWFQIVGGHDPKVTTVVRNQLLPPKLNSSPTSAADGNIVGRVTIALPTGRISDELTAYVLITNPTPQGSFTDPGNLSPNNFGLYKTRNGGLSWTHVELRENRPIVGKLYNFVDIRLTGDEGAEASALAIDPNDANVIYVGGSTRYLNQGDTGVAAPNAQGVGPGTPNPTHGIIRVDTSNMRDTEYISPFYNVITAPNDGDDIIKAATAAEQTTPNPFYREPGNYPAGSTGGGYEGEGVFWYDLQTEDYGQFFFSLTKQPIEFSSRLHLPATIHALTFDPQGRLLIGTEGGIFRGISQGFTYDITSGGAGIMSATSTAPTTGATVVFKSYATPDEPGMIFTDLNGNLQIASQTSVAIDSYDQNVLHSSQISTGWARTSGALPQSLQWTSTNPTAALGSQNVIVNNQNPDNFVTDAPYAGSVVVGPRDPNAPPNVLSNVYRTHQIEIFPTSVIVNANRFRVEKSDQGGLPGTFDSAVKGLNIDAVRFGQFSPLAINPNRINLNGVSQDELLYFTDRVFESDNSALTWDQASQTLLAGGDQATALAFAPTIPDGFYVGTQTGKVFVDLHDGGDGFPNRSNGLPGQPINGITVDPRDATGKTAYVVTGGFSTGTGHVWKTTDGGLSWTNLSGSGSGGTLPDFPAYSMAIDPRSSVASANGFLYVGTEVGVFFSTDNGTTWARLGVIANGDGTFTNTLPNVPVRDIVFNQDFEELAIATLGQGTFVISTDRIGPHVVSFVPGNPAPAGISSVTVTFNESVDPRTFTVDQILSFTGPNGPITALSVDDVDKAHHKTFRITFPKQLTDGTYSLVLKPEMRDFVGNVMDQNQNGIGGELPGDEFSFTFVVNSTDDGRFVTGVYHDLLLRPADTAGFKAFLGPIDQGRALTLFNVSLSMVASDEVRTNFIAGLYSSSDPTGSRSPLLPLGNLLGRPASPADESFWVSILKQGATPEQVIDVIASSAEYFQKNGSTDPTFLAQLYQDILGRPADAAGAAFHLNTLNVAEVTGRFDVAGVITTSQEYRNSLVTAHYFSFLGRAPSTSELAFWTNLMAQGATDEQVIATLIGSQEYFVNHGGDNNNWLNAAYQDILFRGPDPSGTQISLQLLAQGQSRTFVASLLLGSDEYRARVVTGYFGRFLHRALTAADVSFFITEMQFGARDETVLSQILASNEYFQNHFQTRSGTATQLPQQDDNWVRSVFAEVLGRPATDNEALAFEGGVLAPSEATGRATVAATFTGSTEYRTRLVDLVYGRYLGRTPSTGEINLWQPILRQGSSGPGFPSPDEFFLASVIGSNEYLNQQREPDPLDPTTTLATNRQWVKSVFANLVRRTPSQAELDTVLQTVLNGYATQRLQVATVFVTSTEYRQTLVESDFQTFLRRSARPNEVSFYVSAIAAGARAEDVIATLVASDEYFQNPNLGSSDKSKWLNQVYRDLLGRDRDAFSQPFLDRLNAAPAAQLGAVRLEIATEIVDSVEYLNRLVGGVGTGFYSRFLRRVPNAAEVSFWVTQLQSGARDEDVIAQIIASNEYFLGSHVFP